MNISWWMWIVIVIGALIVLTVIYDLCQRKHTILRNYPIVGHFRYWLERFGPELRQYIVTNNNEERPFSRDQRRWVYASAKQENNYFGFGTDKDLELSPNHLVIKHAAFPISSPRPEDPDYDPLHMIDVAKILGGYRDRKYKFRPKSVISVSAMSFGSLSATAVESLNRGCHATGCLHNTGEGGISPYHLSGGNLIWQIGTGYFGARNTDGTFSQQNFLDAIEQAKGKVKAIEIKLSQGAKPGLGGMLPAAKVSPEIAKIRDIPVGRDCVSPASHSAFSNVDEMLDFVEQLADISGLPIGIKSAVGETEFWDDLINQVQNTDRCVDFITIDGSEGGTGAAPLAFSDHVALPFKQAFASVFKKFELAGIAHNIVFTGSGKLGFPETSLLALALGCDMISVAREPMLAIGCIQAQRCHSGNCPAGIATQSKRLMWGLDPTLKSNRLANYIIALRKEIIQLTHACGYEHPAQITPKQFSIVDDNYASHSVADIFGYCEGWGSPTKEHIDEVVRIIRAATEMRITM